MTLSVSEKAAAIVTKLYESYGGYPGKVQMDVNAWHNKLYGCKPKKKEEMELFLKVCDIIEQCQRERN